MKMRIKDIKLIECSEDGEKWLELIVNKNNCLEFRDYQPMTLQVLREMVECTQAVILNIKEKKGVKK